MIYNESTPLVQCANYILDTVDGKGAWGGKDFEDWEPIITALTLEHLLNLGFSPETEWVVADGAQLRHVNLLATITYLNEKVRHDGSFGQDIWDAARLGYIVEHNDLEDRFSGYPRLRKYLIDAVDRRLYEEKESTWSGPGTMSAMVDYFDCARETQRGDLLFRQLLTLQFNDGSFHGPSTEINEELAHPIWHTAQVLMTALRRIPSERDPKIQKMVSFICATQDKSKGCWRAFSHYGVYFTSYAVIALNKLANKPKAVIDAAVAWLGTEVSECGKIRDAGGTIMGSMAFLSVLNGPPIFRAGIPEFRHLGVSESVLGDLNKKVDGLENELKSTKDELARYKGKFDYAEIVLTKKQAFLWATFFSVVGFGSNILDLVRPAKTETPIVVLSQSQLKELQKAEPSTSIANNSTKGETKAK